ncbi:DUF7344 domain-containing protein [Halobellus captivus]|uniref:DUF7344 domain-containing protein n=1 Tax=Halobellus captivus TaxID=2592614 RepID=UPI0011A99C7F|nr:hypothetical protein [Halobellus captivus]
MVTGEFREPSRQGRAQVADADVIFTALSNRRRRLVVRVLREAGEPLDIGELATRIAAHENGIDPDAVTHRQRKSAYTSLHQNHLPRLTDAGFLTVDRRWFDIRLTNRATVLESYLGGDDSQSQPQVWSAALASGFCTTAAISLYPGSNFPSVVLATGGAVCATLLCYWIVSDFSI